MRTFAKRVLCLLMTAAMLFGILPVLGSAASGTTLYLNPGPWNVDGAKFAVYYWNNSGSHWAAMSLNSEGKYEAVIPSGYSNIIFCRMDTTGNLDWDHKWNQTKDLTIPTNGNNCYTVTGWEASSGSWSQYTPPVQEDITCQVTLHFADTLGWGAVYAYGWDSDGGTTLGSWPGTALGTDDTGLYTVTYTLTVPGGEGLNVIFNNGGNGAQTVDLSIPYAELKSGSVERWIQPTTEFVDDDTANTKYNCDILTSADAIVQSPVVSGTSVTFEYKDSSAASVKVAGSWNSWTQVSMTKNSHGVWSYTVNNVTPGIHTYKFVVGSNWITDPVNPWIMGDDDGNLNSAFIILDPNAVDNNEITVKIHYDRSDNNYSGWNAWMWGLTFPSGQYDLANEDGHMTATVKVPGRSTQAVYYILRHSTAENQWESQEFGERKVDLSDIVSGTVHCYVNSGEFGAVRVLDTDVVQKNKISAVKFDYEAGNRVIVTTTRLLSSTDELSITGGASITGITSIGSTYTLTLDRQVALADLYQYKVMFDGYTYDIDYTAAYATNRFAEEFTYPGSDLGANWAEDATAFRVWAPTAKAVEVALYRDGHTNSRIGTHAMTKDVNGTWLTTVSGDLDGVYYTYLVDVDGEIVEACDPYARTTGVNGQRGMILDLDATDPKNWESDENPNKIASYTDAIIYELHVRDFSIDDSSGIRDEWQGKFLGLTQTGTTNSYGISTGLDYLKNLGITHLHLLPIYDYGSVDETKCDSFNWGYDPQNYNTPEGSYSTDPYNGEVRVAEMKQMVSALHENGISLVMDVVYNHVYDAEDFCFNKIVPGYFSRKYDDGSYSNSSGCGNDTASEREMVRKYIIDSVLYWTEEYHINGFRFDLIGLLDVDTVNQLVDEVHKLHPDVLFYGEGWTLGGAVEEGTQMATQANAKLTPHMAYFNDRIRDAMGGYNGSGTGFISGNSEKSAQLAENFRAITDYTTNPQQLIQYISCHDNHTLMAKILKSTGKTTIDSDAVKMNNLAAAIYMTSQGVPFIHAGEEMLRLKIKPDGSFDENSYKSSDDINSIKWNNLQQDMYADASDYYAGLIAFRKAHPALRYATAELIRNNVTTADGSGLTLAFRINGSAAGDIAESIYVIFNGSTSNATMTLPSGSWGVCIDADHAGTGILRTVSGSVSVAPISAMVLVQNQKTPVAQAGGSLYSTVQAAVDTGSPVKLLTDSTESVSGTAVTLDLNGCTLNHITVTEGLILMDSATDDFTGTYGSVAVTGQVTGMDNYLVISENGQYSAHRYELAMTAVTLNPDKDALGYKAQLRGDNLVQSRVESMGFHLWVNESRVVTRSKSGVTALTLRLNNIIGTDGGEMTVYGNAFVVFRDDATVTTDTHATSMRQVLEYVSAHWTSYDPDQQTAVKAFVAAFREKLTDWDISNIQ